MVPLPNRLPFPPGLSIGKYHIHNGWGYGIMQAIRATWIGSFDLMILTETKITDQAHFRNMMGYDVILSKVITTADGNTQGGVGIIIREKPQVWNIDYTHFHGPNTVSCDVITRKRTPLIRAYTPLYTLDHLQYLADALTHFRDQDIIILWDLKFNI